MGRIESSTAQMCIRFPDILSSLASAYDWQKMSGLNAKGLKKTEEKDVTYSVLLLRRKRRRGWGKIRRRGSG